MTTLTITKATLIDAIETEDLRSWGWFGSTNPSNTLAKACPVCAVGAVMRKVLAPTATIRQARIIIEKNVTGPLEAEEGRNLDDLDRAVEVHLATHANPLAALSFAFETLSTFLIRDRELREHLLELVRDLFPASFTIEIGDVAPRETPS